MDYAKELSILGMLMTSHPSIVAMVSQLMDVWKAHAAEILKINDEYVRAASSAADLGPMNQFNIVLQLMKMHPDAVPVIVQVLGILYPHIPETQKTLTQIQVQAVT